MISILDQYNVVHLLLKYFLSRALAAILAARASFLFSGYIAIKFSFFFLISNIFIDNVDFAIQIFPIKNI